MNGRDKALRAYEDEKFKLEQFLSGVLIFFEKHPNLSLGQFPIIHSVKSRFKNSEHLKDKLERKRAKGVVIDDNNIFDEVTDLIGVRVLHLYQDQFEDIHKAVKAQVDAGEWLFVEEPKAYTWDPESSEYFENLGLETEVRETFYTSIHYLIKPNNSNSKVCCEIQVRTLFEEIWGEIDHTINYPHKTESVACKEQLRVLSKLVSTGTRLADSIFRSHNEHIDTKK